MKLHVNKTSILAGAGILFIALFVFCAFPFQGAGKVELSDISKQLNYHEISRQGFMGRSVLYNPGQPSSGQLVEGVHVAVRLGQVDRYDTVQLNEKAAINGDGLADATYTKPTLKRPGMENALYLTFLSSQEDLNTSMFAVLPEQYSQGVYPSGIIGINIDGKFIVSKYESNTTIRSAVQGITNGDFVLDTIEGDYKRVIHTVPSRSARSISDSERGDIESSTPIVSYKFVESEFAYGYDADVLFSALPDTVKNLYLENETTLQKLNRVLENRDLIILVSKARDTSITEDKFAEITTEIAALSDDEVTQINRIFLDMVYPDVCPQSISESNSIAEVLGLAIVVFGGEANETSDYTRAATKASSSADYDKRFKEINSWYESSYNDLWKKTLPVNIPGFPGITVNNSFIKIGMRGTFTCV
jgi:hypothetical protein